MSGIGFLIREMHARDLRIRSGPFAEWINGEFQELPDRPEDANLLCNVFKDGSRGVPGMWWLIEAAEPQSEMARDALLEKNWTRDWEERAGSLVEAINSMHWVFEFVIHGEIRAPRHEWLCCDVCDESQGTPKAYGAASQKRKCHSTPHCTGILRRLPNIWAITHPKPIPKSKKTAAARPEVAEKLRAKQLHSTGQSADTEAA